MGRELGVTGVPFFRISAPGRRPVTLSGAQPPEAMADARRTVMPAADAASGGAACGPDGCPM